MEKERFILNSKNAAALSVSPEDADRLLALDQGEAALLYVYILRRGGELDMAQAARDLGRTETAIEVSALALRRAGLLSAPDRPLPAGAELPQYTAGDVIRRSREDPAFKALVNECQRLFGHTLSGADLRTLFGIYDQLGMSGEVILLMINHCAARLQKRYGEGRLPTMRSVEKEAFRWADREIFTAAQAEEYIEQSERLEQEEEKARQALNITGRPLTPTERRYLESWLAMGFGSKALALAYDRTVVSTGKLTWPYMNKILCSWQQKGLYTVEDVEKGDPRPDRKKPAAVPAAKTAGDDLDRLMRMLDIKEE